MRLSNLERRGGGGGGGGGGRERSICFSCPVENIDEVYYFSQGVKEVGGGGEGVTVLLSALPQYS